MAFYPAFSVRVRFLRFFFNTSLVRLHLGFGSNSARFRLRIEGFDTQFDLDKGSDLGPTLIFSSVQ